MKKQTKGHEATFERRTLNKETILKAIGNSYGIISAIAKKLSCDRKTVYRWIKKDEQVKAAFNSERDALIDLAEIKLIKKINDGDSSMIALVLKTLGKGRGYTEGKPNNLDDEKINELKKFFDSI